MPRSLYFADAMTTANCVEILLLANAVRLDELRSLALTFCACNFHAVPKAAADKLLAADSVLATEMLQFMSRTLQRR